MVCGGAVSTEYVCLKARETGVEIVRHASPGGVGTSSPSPCDP